MTDSAKIELPPHDPIASTAERGGRPYRHERLAAPARGHRSPHPLGPALDQHLVGDTDRSRGARSRDRRGPELARASQRAGIHQGLSRHRPVRALGRFRLPVVAAATALPEHALHDVHHPRGHPDPGRSPAALLDAGLHARHGLVPLPASGPGRPGLDLEGRFGDHPALARHSRRSPFDRACPLVAFLHRDAVDDQRRRLLRAAFRDRPMAASGPDHLGRVPCRALDGAPVFVAELPRRPELDPLQRPAAAHLFHHGVHCCPGFDRYRPHAEPGDLQPGSAGSERC